MKLQIPTSILAFALGLTFSLESGNEFSLSKANAQSEDACAIWICLPGGFPSGCGNAYSAFVKRLRKGRPPLPALSSCTVGGTTGSYSIGFAPFEECREGYTTRDGHDDDRFNPAITSRTCVNLSSCSRRGRDDEEFCTDIYRANRRPQPHYIDMIVDGTPLPRQYYSLP